MPKFLIKRLIEKSGDDMKNETGKREKLIMSAIGLFAEYGYDKVSIRQIAADAGANSSMISYYFGSKQGLYEAILRELINNFDEFTMLDAGRLVSFVGFTEDEVKTLCEKYRMDFEQVKKWYDGFTFGTHKDIYNPWSITNFLDKKQFRPYWASTSSNGLVNKLIRTASADIKTRMEELLQEREIVVTFDEQIVFNQLDKSKNAIWSLLLAGGYLKAEEVEYRGMLLEPWYHLRITNLETYSMFSNMFKGWFDDSMSNYNEFIEALLKGNLKEMNIYMNDIALTTFSSFDTGNHPSKRSQPERFYHGFVLGLLVELRDSYDVRSNRESGYGRYDIMLVPHDQKNNAIVMEFKVHEADEEETLEDTVQAALKQIREKNYDAGLTAAGIPKEKIRHYGFAFEGKKVLIGK